MAGTGGVLSQPHNNTPCNSLGLVLRTSSTVAMLALTVLFGLHLGQHISLPRVSRWMAISCISVSSAASALLIQRLINTLFFPHKERVTLQAPVDDTVAPVFLERPSYDLLDTMTIPTATLQQVVETPLHHLGEWMIAKVDEAYILRNHNGTKISHSKHLDFEHVRTTFHALRRQDKLFGKPLPPVKNVTLRDYPSCTLGEGLALMERELASRQWVAFRVNEGDHSFFVVRYHRQLCSTTGEHLFATRAQADAFIAHMMLSHSTLVREPLLPQEIRENKSERLTDYEIPYGSKSQLTELTLASGQWAVMKKREGRTVAARWHIHYWQGDEKKEEIVERKEEWIAKITQLRNDLDLETSYPKAGVFQIYALENSWECLERGDKRLVFYVEEERQEGDIFYLKYGTRLISFNTREDLDWYMLALEKKEDLNATPEKVFVPSITSVTTRSIASLPSLGPGQWIIVGEEKLTLNYNLRGGARPAQENFLSEKEVLDFIGPKMGEGTLIDENPLTFKNLIAKSPFSSWQHLAFAQLPEGCGWIWKGRRGGSEILALSYGKHGKRHRVIDVSYEALFLLWQKLCGQRIHFYEPEHYPQINCNTFESPKQVNRPPSQADWKEGEWASIEVTIEDCTYFGLMKHGQDPTFFNTREALDEEMSYLVVMKELDIKNQVVPN